MQEEGVILVAGGRKCMMWSETFLSEPVSIPVKYFENCFFRFLFSDFHLGLL